MAANITWYAKTKYMSQFLEGNSLYSGTCQYGKDIDVELQLWNNRYGTEDADDLENFRIIAKFRDKEDASLLDHLNFMSNGKQLTYTINKQMQQIELVFKQNIVLSGASNDGSDSSNENKDNFLPIEVIFHMEDGETLKENDLKNLYLTVVVD